MDDRLPRLLIGLAAFVLLVWLGVRFVPGVGWSDVLFGGVDLKRIERLVMTRRPVSVSRRRTIATWGLVLVAVLVVVGLLYYIISADTL